MNFSTVKGLSIPEGVVTQITDASGRVIWAVQNNKPVVLEVEKITSDTYAGETTYTGEQFILLDIYPKTASSTVNVTYGGLTKTLTFSGTNAQQVYFGTFNGVSDSMATPASGTLTIEGDYDTFGVGNFSTNNKNTARCGCVTSIADWGNIKRIPAFAFNSCKSLVLSSLPSGITSIGDSAFAYCPNITINQIPEGVTSIEVGAFMMDNTNTTSLNGEADTKLRGKDIILPSTITTLGDLIFTFEEVETTTSTGLPDETEFNCYLSTITILATTPPTVGTICDDSRTSPQIIVPKGCGEAYKTADGWSTYASKIVEAS